MIVASSLRYRTLSGSCHHPHQAKMCARVHLTTGVRRTPLLGTSPSYRNSSVAQVPELDTAISSTAQYSAAASSCSRNSPTGRGSILGSSRSTNGLTVTSGGCSRIARRYKVVHRVGDRGRAQYGHDDSAAGRRRKTLTRIPLSTVARGEVAEAQRSVRSGKSAKRTDAGIRSGLDPLAAYCRIAAERETRQEGPASTQLSASLCSVNIGSRRVHMRTEWVILGG